jgi:hypothetical protein
MPVMFSQAWFQNVTVWLAFSAKTPSTERDIKSGNEDMATPLARLR